MEAKKPTVPETEIGGIAYGYICPACNNLHKLSYVTPDSFALDDEMKEEIYMELEHQYYKMHGGKDVPLFEREAIKDLTKENEAELEPSSIEHPLESVSTIPKEYEESEKGMRVETESKMEQQIDEYIDQLVNTPSTEIWDSHPSSGADSREELNKIGITDIPKDILPPVKRVEDTLYTKEPNKAKEKRNARSNGKGTRDKALKKPKRTKIRGKPSELKVVLKINGDTRTPAEKFSQRVRKEKPGIRFNFPPQ